LNWTTSAKRWGLDVKSYRWVVAWRGGRFDSSPSC